MQNAEQKGRSLLFTKIMKEEEKQEALVELAEEFFVDKKSIAEISKEEIDAFKEYAEEKIEERADPVAFYGRQLQEADKEWKQAFRTAWQRRGLGMLPSNEAIENNNPSALLSLIENKSIRRDIEGELMQLTVQRSIFSRKLQDVQRKKNFEESPLYEQLMERKERYAKEFSEKYGEAAKARREKERQEAEAAERLAIAQAQAERNKRFEEWRSRGVKPLVRKRGGTSYV